MLNKRQPSGKSQQGFTLLETFIYFAVFGLILGAIVKLEIQTIGTYNRNHYQEKVGQNMLQMSNYLQNLLDGAKAAGLEQGSYDFDGTPPDEDYQIITITKPAPLSNFTTPLTLVEEKYRLRFNLNANTLKICRGDSSICVATSNGNEWVSLLDEGIETAANSSTAIEMCFGGGVDDGKKCTGSNCVGGNCEFVVIEENTIGPCLTTCGNGDDSDPGEACDDGGICSDNGVDCETDYLDDCADSTSATCILQSGDGCSATCSPESIINHNFNNRNKYFYDSALVEFNNGKVQLKLNGDYSTKKPYVQLKTPVTLVNPTQLEDIIETGVSGTVEYSVEIDDTVNPPKDWWWDGSGWIENTGELRSGDSLYDGGNLISVWHMDEAIVGTCSPSGDICDSKGSNNGTYNGVQYSQSGQIKTAIGFNGTSDYVDVGNDTSLRITGTQVTVSAWINPGDVSGNKIIVGKRGGVGTPYDLMLINVNPYFYIKADGTGYDVMSAATVSTGNWYHVVAVYNSTDMLIYVNGVVQPDTQSFTGNLPDTVNNVMIGKRSDGNFDYFNGIIDEVAIWDTALSENDIIRLYADQNNDKHSNDLATMNANLPTLFPVNNNDTVTLLTYLVSQDGSQSAEADNVALNYSPAQPSACGDGSPTCAVNTCTRAVKDIKFHLQLNNDLGDTNPWYYSIPNEMSFTIPYYD